MWNVERMKGQEHLEGGGAAVSDGKLQVGFTGDLRLEDFLKNVVAAGFWLGLDEIDGQDAGFPNASVGVLKAEGRVGEGGAEQGIPRPIQRRDGRGRGVEIVERHGACQGDGQAC